jgi:hypothetical protein
VDVALAWGVIHDWLDRNAPGCGST